MSNVLRYRSSQNLCSPSCPVEHIDFAGDRIKQPPKSWPDLRGLHSLNFSREKWLTGDAIEVSIEEYCCGLPQALQDKIGLGIPGLRPDVWSRGSKGTDALVMAISVPQRRALARFSKTEYSLFPICVNHNHWVLVFMRKTAAKGTDEFLHVTDIAVIDPQHKSATVTLVISRLQQWLTNAGNFTFAPSSTRIVWAPLQRDSCSCGPRAYWNAKQLMDRLLELHEGIIDRDALWNDLSGWFNEDFVRGEMTGRCAWAAVRGMDYKARVAVECVNRVRQHGVRDATWQDADRMMRAVDIRNKKPDQRPHSAVATLDDEPDDEPDDATAHLSRMQISEGTPSAASPKSDAKIKIETPDTILIKSIKEAPVPKVYQDWKPSPPMPNQHRLMSDLKAGANTPIIISDSADETDQEPSKGPAFSKSMSRRPLSSGKTKGTSIFIVDTPKSAPPAARGPSFKSKGPTSLERTTSKRPYGNIPPPKMGPLTGTTPPNTVLKQQQYGRYTPGSTQVNPKDDSFVKGAVPDPFTGPSESTAAGLFPTPISLPNQKVQKTASHPDPIARNLFPKQSGSSPKLPVTFSSPRTKSPAGKPFGRERASSQVPNVQDSAASPSKSTGTAVAAGSRKRRREQDDSDVEILLVMGPLTKIPRKDDGESKGSREEIFGQSYSQA